MTIRRRNLTGTPLLVATAGAAISLVGCDGIVSTSSGNLVAPPMVELCVNLDPVEAVALVDGQDFEADGCLDVYEGSHFLQAEAEGYLPYAETIEVNGDTTHDIVMTPES
jgi:hypothetical protein